jgi:hypothetical protein
VSLGFMDLQIPVGEIYDRVEVPEQMIVLEEADTI